LNEKIDTMDILQNAGSEITEDHPLVSLDSFKFNLAYSDIEKDKNFADSHDPNLFKGIKAMQMGL
jgi:hypothetical protein